MPQSPRRLTAYIDPLAISAGEIRDDWWRRRKRRLEAGAAFRAAAVAAQATQVVAAFLARHIGDHFLCFGAPPHFSLRIGRYGMHDHLHQWQWHSYT